ncbi:mucin-5AC-like [Anopheles darlingi]|uniref:mucin-5AC-like n=1 Tax=Anopheles darlingi TaxID=43151 RepID=UPI0021002E08|nr:mucin-5AC-like [Anopheles darlingi]
MLLRLEGITTSATTTERAGTGTHRSAKNSATTTTVSVDRHTAGSTSEVKPIPSRLGTRNEEINRNTVTSQSNSTGMSSAFGSMQVTVTMLHRTTTSAPPALATSTTTAPTTTSSTASTITSSRSTTEQPARKVDILIYPTVSPETIVVPILSCIIGFPIFALLVICCLRRRAKIARERDRRRNFDLKANTITLVRFNSHHINSQRSILLQSGDSLSRGYPSLDLDTVYEERSDTHGSAQLDSPAAHMLPLSDSAPDTDNEHC